MTRDFVFSKTPFLHFGEHKFHQLSKLLKPYGSSVALMTGKNSFVNSDHWTQLQELFEKASIRWKLHQVGKEPTPEMVDNAVRFFTGEEVHAVVAIGGGSVVDAGKAVSAMIPLGPGVKDYLEGVGTRSHPGIKIPFIAIPTTAGTGSEATKNAVISSTGENGFKKSLRHDHFVPDIALVDPLLSLNCPAYITAYSGMDAFTQLLESYLSTAGSPLTDALALEGLHYIKTSLAESFADGYNNRLARAGMAYASYLSGVTLANAGLGTVHGFASVIGGYYDIPHGVICSRLMYTCNKYTLAAARKNKEMKVLDKYYTAASLFFKTDQSRDYLTDAFLDLIDKWTHEMNIPGLAACGVKREDLSRIAKETENKNNPVNFTAGELEEILASAL